MEDFTRADPNLVQVCVVNGDSRAFVGNEPKPESQESGVIANVGNVRYLACPHHNPEILYNIFINTPKMSYQPIFTRDGLLSCKTKYRLDLVSHLLSTDLVNHQDVSVIYEQSKTTKENISIEKKISFTSDDKQVTLQLNIEIKKNKESLKLELESTKSALIVDDTAFNHQETIQYLNKNPEILQNLDEILGVDNGDKYFIIDGSYENSNRFTAVTKDEAGWYKVEGMNNCGEKRHIFYNPETREFKNWDKSYTTSKYSADEKLGGYCCNALKWMAPIFISQFEELNNQKKDQNNPICSDQGFFGSKQKELKTYPQTSNLTI